MLCLKVFITDLSTFRMIENVCSTFSKGAPSAISSDGASTASSEAQTFPSYELPEEGVVAAAPTATSASANLTASELSQAAAAASSQALAEALSSTDAGTQVSILAQVIIAIGVIPVQLIIVSIVLGLHRLVHRKSPRPLQMRIDSAIPTKDPPPYLQPKAELEDDQNKRHELHDEHLVRELDGGNEVHQIADGTENVALSLHGRQGIGEMPEPHDLSWEMPHQERTEVMGDEIAQELACLIPGREESVETKHVQELESQVQATAEPIKVEADHDLAGPGDHLAIDMVHSNPSRSHFMLRQQQAHDINASRATD